MSTQTVFFVKPNERNLRFLLKMRHPVCRVNGMLDFCYILLIIVAMQNMSKIGE